MSRWGVRQADMEQYHGLVEAVMDNARYSQPGLEQRLHERATSIIRPLEKQLSPQERAYQRAHQERSTLRSAADRAAVLAVNASPAPRLSRREEAAIDPSLPGRLDDEFGQGLLTYAQSPRYAADVRERTKRATGTWLGRRTEDLLAASAQPYLYGRAGALALQQQFGGEVAPGSAVEAVLADAGESAGAVQDLLLQHEVLQLTPDHSGMRLDPARVEYLASQALYNLPGTLLPQQFRS